MLHTLAISGYRSIRDLVVPLERLTVVTGPNGSGNNHVRPRSRDQSRGNPARR